MFNNLNTTWNKLIHRRAFICTACTELSRTPCTMHIYLADTVIKIRKTSDSLSISGGASSITDVWMHSCHVTDKIMTLILHGNS